MKENVYRYLFEFSVLSLKFTFELQNSKNIPPNILELSERLGNTTDPMRPPPREIKNNS